MIQGLSCCLLPTPLQPVQLVVLPGALQQLGPPTPWRYTAGRLATLDLQVREDE